MLAAYNYTMTKADTAAKGSVDNVKAIVNIRVGAGIHTKPNSSTFPTFAENVTSWDGSKKIENLS